MDEPILKDLLRPEILEMIEARSWAELRDVLEEWPAPEVADLILHLRKPDRVLLFRSLPRRQAAEVFAHLDFEEQDALLRDLTDEETPSCWRSCRRTTARTCSKRCRARRRSGCSTCSAPRICRRPAGCWATRRRAWDA